MICVDLPGVEGGGERERDFPEEATQNELLAAGVTTSEQLTQRGSSDRLDRPRPLTDRRKPVSTDAPVASICSDTTSVLSLGAERKIG